MLAFRGVERYIWSLIGLFLFLVLFQNQLEFDTYVTFGRYGLFLLNCKFNMSSSLSSAR